MPNSKDKEQKEKENQESKSIIDNNNNNNNNTIIANEIKENVDLSSPVPSFPQKKGENGKNRLYEIYY
jgi:hypothetical protein